MSIMNKNEPELPLKVSFAYVFKLQIVVLHLQLNLFKNNHRMSNKPAEDVSIT